MLTNIGSLELNITRAQAERGSHRGPCDDDIAALRNVPAIRRQLARLSPSEVAGELREYGAWGRVELADHDANLSRLLWLACGNIVEGFGS
jgi:hypothetical protein